MRKFLSLASVLALGLAGIAADAATAVSKNSTAKKGSHTAASAQKSVAAPRSGAKTTSSRSTASSKRGKRTTRRTATTWRSRQLSPTPERYKEIQAALASKGYLTADQANGKWDDASTAALKKFQTDQNLDGNGKINSLSLIALGLGPKRETPNAAKPAAIVPAAVPTPPATPAPASLPPENLQ